MGGCFGMFLFGVFMAALKAVAFGFRLLWRGAMQVLQFTAGRELAICRPAYRLPAQLLGATGLLSLTCSPLATVHPPGGRTDTDQWLAFVAAGAIGASLVWLSRVLIRRGSR